MLKFELWNAVLGRNTQGRNEDDSHLGDLRGCTVFPQASPSPLERARPLCANKGAAQVRVPFVAPSA